MNDDWDIYRAKMLRHVRRVPFWLLSSLVPFLGTLPFWWQKQMVWMGLAVSLVYGLVVPATVWLSFGAAYAAAIHLAARAGRKLKTTVYFRVAIGLVGMVLGIWVAQRINHWALGVPMDGAAFLPSFILGGIIVALILLFEAYQDARAEALQLSAANAEARYHTLQQQMRPHFLFNALNSLAELIESKQENAAEVAYQLSELYRRILANSARKTASLASELEIVRAYLELEQLRFGERLRFRINAPRAAEQIFLPSLMLQTLVENAVKHGIVPALDGGEIEITIASAREPGYCLRVANTGVPLKADTQGKGAGLANTRARLVLLYGDGHNFALRTDERGRTVASCHFTGEQID